MKRTKIEKVKRTYREEDRSAHAPYPTYTSRLICVWCVEDRIASPWETMGINRIAQISPIFGVLHNGTLHKEPPSYTRRW